MKFTFAISEMDPVSIEKDSPFLVREIDDESDCYMSRSCKELGFLFDTQEEALEAAKRFYYCSLAAKMGRPWKTGGPNAVICYDETSKRLLARSMDGDWISSVITSPWYFDSEINACEALRQIGELNYAKYVMGLRGIDLLVLNRL